MIFLSCDPGATGALGAIEKESGKLIDFVYDFDSAKYKQFFEKYKGLKVILEFIPTVMGGPFASFSLGQNIGEIRGLSYGLCEIIEKGNMPKQWKTPWKDDFNFLDKQYKIVKETNKKLTNKEKDIIICKKYYPDINLLVPELEKDGKPKFIKKGPEKGQRKMKEHDGICDMYLIGQSAIIRGII